MKWLGNTHNPNDPDWESYVPVRVGQTHQQACDMHLRWLKGKIIGKPMATDSCTVKKLESFGYVGVYAP